MIFISLLILTTFAIAGSAAFFSVYGLAFTFSGTFWSVVLMGSSLEAGKLIATSYLYRYWLETNKWLRAYLMAGIAALMLLTSTGIFGYLSSGYQADVLPLKQMSEQVRLLDEERTRTIARKKQIDDQIAKGPTVQNMTKGEDIDPNAIRALREATRARDSVGKQFKAEQEQVTKRITQIDTEILVLRQNLVKTEAHVGPIVYIAKAFGLDTDDATKYLIYLIIFTFDPMAVALTLSANIAIKVREEEKQAPQLPVATLPEPKDDDFDPADWMEISNDPEPPKQPPTELVDEAHQETLPVAEPAPTQVVVPEAPPAKRSWNFPGSNGKINELMSHYKYLKDKKVSSFLTIEEQTELRNIEQILQRHGGLHIYA